MATAAAGAEPLDIGKVIRDIFTVLSRNFVPFLALSAILAGLPAVVVGMLQASALGGAATVTPAAALSQLPNTLFVLLVALVTGLILQGALVYGTISDMNGKKPLVADCITVGLRNFLPLFAIGLLVGLAVVFGMILLIVPGIMIAVAWCVAVPAFVAERLNVMDSFGRSADLTRGNRWRIFALFLVYLVASIIINIVVGAIGGAISLAAGSAALAVRAVLIQPVISTLSAMIGATGAAVLYMELRMVREGVGPEALASVFD
jgi:hypothetical protein